jgi:pimeloyl-ACP methyl ester carboxylesterase
MTLTDTDPLISPFVPPPDAPPWFLENLKNLGESRYVDVFSAQLHFRCWNWDDESLPVLVLVHGLFGHAHWWSFLAPFFTNRYRIAAIDLPGMGDSSPLSQYSENCFAQAIVDFIQHCQLQSITIIGHSFGGIQTIRAMILKPELFKHAMVVDSYVRFPPGEMPKLIDPRGSHKLRSTRSDCVSKFRIVPPQTIEIDALLQFVAHHSCTGDSNGWYWKFDPNIQNFGELRDFRLLRNITARVDVIYGELSMFNSEDRPQRIFECFSNSGELVLIPKAHHHIMLDRPLEFVASINRLVSEASKT